MKIPARFLLSFLTVLVFLFYFASPIFSQTTNTNPYIAPNTNPDVPKNMHTWTQGIMIEVMSSMACQLTGIDPVNPKQQCLGIDQKTGKIGFMPSGANIKSKQIGGAIGIMTNMIGTLYTPPFHSSDYFHYLAGNFGIVKQTYAAEKCDDKKLGIGFCGINPLIHLWIAFRDIVYLLFIIIFVVIGLLIMLRIKIDPRTVMSIENQLPKIIVGIILVSFSFAIAGFMIDLMYVLIYVIINTLSVDPGIQANVGTISSNLNVHPVLFLDTIFKTPGSIIPGILQLIIHSADRVGTIFRNTIFPVKDLQPIFHSADSATDCGFLGINCAMTIGQNLIGPLLTNVLGFILGWVVGILAFLIIAVAVLWSMFRLWFALLTAYVFILVDVVLAPFMIIIGIFPGAPLGFSGWLRDIAANLSAFPIAIMMLLLGKVFMDAFSSPDAQNPFVPPLIGGDLHGQDLAALIGLGIILMTPQVLTMMRDYLKAPQFKYTAGIGQAVGVGSAGPGRLAQFVGHSLTHRETESGVSVYKKSTLGTLGRLLGL